LSLVITHISVALRPRPRPLRAAREDAGFERLWTITGFVASHNVKIRLYLQHTGWFRVVSHMRLIIDFPPQDVGRAKWSTADE